MFYLNTHKHILDNFIQQKYKDMLHHSFIFKVKDTVLLDDFIKSLCQIILNQKVNDYNESPYITIAHSDKNEIRVAEIKKIIKNCELAAHNNLAKIIIIPELFFLNQSATNAILKTLEEPAENTFFLMFTQNYNNILKTIKSRSLTYNIKFSDDDKYNYLKYTFNMSEDAIKKSLLISRDDVNVITKIKLEQRFWQVRNSLMKVLVNQLNINLFFKEVYPNFKDTLYWLTNLIIDVYYYKLNEANRNIANYDKIAIVKFLAAKLSEEKIYKLYKKTLEATNYFINFKNIDKELVLENIILKIIE